MNSRFPFAAAAPRRTLTALAAACALAACGGGGNHGEIDTTAIEAPMAMQTSVVPPLLADDGSVMPGVPQAEPTDPAAATRSRRYVLRRQAEVLGEAMTGEVMWADAGCCEPDVAASGAAVRQALSDSSLPDDAPVFVTGSDARRAAALADWLESSGLSRVFVVTR